MSREFPIRLPLQYPQEAYIDMSTFNRSLTSSTSYYEKTHGVSSDWGRLIKSQESVIKHLKTLAIQIEKLSTKTSDPEAIKFCNDMIDLLYYYAPSFVNIKPMSEEQKIAQDSKKNDEMILMRKYGRDDKSSSIISKVIQK